MDGMNLLEPEYPPAELGCAEHSKTKVYMTSNIVLVWSVNKDKYLFLAIKV